MSAKRTGTKRARGGDCCSHIEGIGHSVNQLRLLLLKVLPEGVLSAATGSHQQHVCISCQKSAKDGFQEAGPDCDHTISLDTHRLELHCRCCKDFVYLETFDEALLLACQQWMQQKRSNGHCGIPSNDPGPALLTKRQRLTSAASPEPGCNRSSNTSSQTAVEAAANAANADQQQVAALAAATAGSWEACVAPDGFPLGLRGLNNLGNTCFMNSVLQVMLHAPLLRSFYLGEGHDPGTCRLTARDKPCLSCQMDTVFGEVYSGNRQPFSPAEFLYQWWRFADSLAGYQQQDAHEFYLSLLEGLSGSMVPLGPAPPAAAAYGNRDSPGSRQPGSNGRQQQQQEQGAVVPNSNPVQGVDAGYLNVLGGSMAGFGPGMVPAGALQQLGLQPRQPHPSLTAPPLRQHHTDPLPLQLDQPQQQAGSSGLNGWPLDPQSQQQQSGPGGDLSGYETPISSGATPEPEGDTEAASRPPDEGPTAALVDLVFSGLLRSDVRCCACGHTSTAHDPFRDISLDLHVPRPPRLPPAEPHHRPPAKATAAVAAGAAAGAQAGREQDAGQAGGPDQLVAAEVSPAVAAAAKRLGISGPLATGGEVDLLGLREVTPPLLVGMTPSPTPPPSDLLIEYWDNTDNERDTAAGGSRLLSGRDAREASQATSMSRPVSAATGLEEGDGEGGLSTALSREVGEEDEVMQQQDEAGTAEGPGGSQEPPAAAADRAVSGKDAVSAGTLGGSLTPEPMSEGGEESEESEKSPGASEVGGPVASQSSQQVGGLRAACQREATPELDAPAGGAAGAGGAAAQQLQRRGADMRESTPQSQATQPSQQQQQGFEPPQQQGTQPSNTAANQQQDTPADGGAADPAAAPPNAAGVSSIVRGVGGGLSQLVKGPMSAIKQTAATAIKLLPGWGGAAGDDQQQQQQQGEQQYQQQYGSTQLDQQQQPLQQQQQQSQDQQQQQQQLGTFPSGYSDVSGMGQAGQYDMAAMHQYAQQSYQDPMQQYHPQQQQMYLDSWGMQPYDSSGYDPAAYSGDWMQHSQMYNSGYVDPAAAAAAPVGAVPGPGSGAGGKASKGAAALKPRQTRCGKCKYCINRHLKKGCEANKKLREEAKAAAKAQARLAAEDRAAVQRAAAQRAAQNIAATAAAENDPAAAAAQPVFGAPDSAAAAAGAGATQPTHPLGGMRVHPGATAGAGWAHPGGVSGAHPGAMYQQHHQQFNPADYYAQQQQQQMQGQIQPGPTAGAAAGFPPARQQHTAPPAVKPAKPKSAVASAVKVSERLVAAALTAGLLKKRDGKGRFYRKEHLQAWAKLLYERGQITTHGLPAVTPEAAAAAAATQDAAMAAGTAEWPLPPWMQPQEPAGAQGAGVGGAGAPVRPASAPPALKTSGQASKATASVKKGSSTGASISKKALPAVLRMNDLTLAGCLRRYVRPERLGSAAHWRCSACGGSTAALKQLSFRRLPLVLCFHVKRFEHAGGAAQRPRKLDVPMRFPLHGLDMAPFTTSHMLRGLSHAQHCKPAAAPESRAGADQAGGPAGAGAGTTAAGAGAVGVDGDGAPSFQQSCLYELFGVVSHWGDMSSGHYVSYIKCDGAWYLINDPWVVAVSEADVAGVQAYMLFYAQEYLFGTGSSGELAEHQRRQRAEAAAAVVAAAAAASAKVKPESAVKTEAGAATGVGLKPDPGAAAAAAGAVGDGSGVRQPAGGQAAGGGAAGVKVEPGL